MRNHDKLAAAIVEQAIKDYKSALKFLMKKGELNTDFTLKNPYLHSEPAKMKKEVERFFLGDWFKELSDLDGQMIINKVREQVLDG